MRDFLRSGDSERNVTLTTPSAGDTQTYTLERIPTRVRLIRDVTPTSSVRVLMTSLLDAEHYPAAAFGALYHRRWRIEEAFKRIKHRLRLEAATGLSHLAFQQDFAAKILADNLHAALTASVPHAARDDAGEPATPTQRPNRTYAIGTLKPILVGCLLRVKHCLCALADALAVIARTRCRIQPGRTYPRPHRHKPHLYAAYRMAC